MKPGGLAVASNTAPPLRLRSRDAGPGDTSRFDSEGCVPLSGAAYILLKAPLHTPARQRGGGGVPFLTPAGPAGLAEVMEAVRASPGLAF
jgi:hypothetical protein